MGMVADYKPFTSKTGKLIPAKASKKSGHEIGALSLGEFRRENLFFQLVLWDSVPLGTHMQYFSYF